MEEDRELAGCWGWTTLTGHRWMSQPSEKSFLHGDMLFLGLGHSIRYPANVYVRLDRNCDIFLYINYFT